MKNFKTKPYLVSVNGSWKELRTCESWLTLHLGKKGPFRTWMASYVDITAKHYYDDWLGKGYTRRVELQIRFNNEEDVLAFKLAFEE